VPPRRLTVPTATAPLFNEAAPRVSFFQEIKMNRQKRHGESELPAEGRSGGTAPSSYIYTSNPPMFKAPLIKSGPFPKEEYYDRNRIHRTIA